ncbi:MAG: glycosyltransferase family 2 protein [Verrucomicrobiota bacterium]
MKSDIRLSVALVTRNNPESLQRCLASLYVQEVQPFEVVVSDDSDEALVPATRKIATHFGCRYASGPRRGLYANRNAAALLCSGTHMRTMDDDHTFPSGHFARCLSAVHEDPRAVWTTGESCFVDGKFYVSADTAPQLNPAGVGGPVQDPDDNWAISDGSTIYPLEIFNRGLRMLEAFGYGSNYLEFGAYVYRHGYRSRCVRGAFVEHHATSAMLRRTSLESYLFASLCHNLYFKRNLALAAKYLASYTMIHQPSLMLRVPSLLKQLNARWGSIIPPLS